MTGCAFCQGNPPDWARVKAYSTCDLLDGHPCLPCKEYIDLETKISAVKRTLDDMFAQQREIRAKINYRHDPITHRFPVEITSAIFQHTLPENWKSFNALDQESIPSAEEELRSGALVLGSVCRSWRSIAWSSPRLWTVIRIFLNLDNENPNRVDVAQNWLFRAGQLPLSIRLSFWRDIDDDSEPRETNIGRQLIALVNHHSDRWTELEVRAPNWVLSQLCEGFQNAPNLRTLRMVCSEANSDEFEVNSSTFRPTHVAMYLHNLTKLDIDWSHVTHVFAGRFFVDECVELLRQATQLVCLELTDILADQEMFPLPDQPILRPTLLSLKIRGAHENNHTHQVYGRQVLDNITLPFLSDLESFGLYPKDLVALIARSSCPLTSLATSYNFNPGSLLSLLSKTPLLQKMTLVSTVDSYSGSGNTYVRRLPDTSSISNSSHDQSTPNSPHNVVCLPNLRCIQTVGYMPEHKFDEFRRFVPGIWNYAPNSSE